MMTSHLAMSITTELGWSSLNHILGHNVVSKSCREKGSTHFMSIVHFP